MIRLGCIFDSDSIEFGNGVCVFTHTPTKFLRPDTVIPENFTVTAENKKIKVMETVYDPYENSLKLILNESIANCAVGYSSNGVLDVDGSVSDISGKACAYEEKETMPDSLSIIGVCYMSDGVPTDNFVNLINAEIKLVVTNSNKSSFDSVRASLNASDGSLITFEDFDIEPYQTREIWLRVNGYLFKDNDFVISLK